MILSADSYTELHCEPHLDALANGQPFSFLQDYSGKNRMLSSTGSQPICQTNSINGKSAVLWDGTNTPLVNNSTFQIRCGWIVAKYAGATFASYNGLLSGLVSQSILVGNLGTSNFNYFPENDAAFYEFRSGDRIYPPKAAPAPMNQYKLLFFRFWQPVTVQGVEIGQQTNLTTRRWNGQVAFLRLDSRNYCEQEIREKSKTIADYFAMSLADVYPYQADKDTPEEPEQSVNFYDPPEGERLSEVITGKKRTFELKFTSRRQQEKREMIAFHDAHYATAQECVIRNYNDFPPTDAVGYIDSQYKLTGAVNNYNYGFRFKEK